VAAGGTGAARERAMRRSTLVVLAIAAPTLLAITKCAWADSLEEFQGCLTAHTKNRTIPQIQDCAHNYAPLPQRDYTCGENESYQSCDAKHGRAVRAAIRDAHNFATCLVKHQPNIMQRWQVATESWRVCLLNAERADSGLCLHASACGLGLQQRADGRSLARADLISAPPGLAPQKE
jgi:hypothetical protein